MRWAGTVGEVHIPWGQLVPALQALRGPPMVRQNWSEMEIKLRTENLMPPGGPRARATGGQEAQPGSATRTQRCLQAPLFPEAAPPSFPAPSACTERCSFCPALVVSGPTCVRLPPPQPLSQLPPWAQRWALWFTSSPFCSGSQRSETFCQLIAWPVFGLKGPWVLLGAPLCVNNPNRRTEHGRGGEREELGAPSFPEWGDARALFPVGNRTGGGE